MKKILPIIIFFFLNFSLTAANRYWVASVSSNYNNTLNWSTSSGGSGGASVPTAGDFVFFNANGTGNCTLDINANFDGIRIEAGYTGVIDLAGFNFNPSTSGGSATCTFDGGTISDITNTSNITYTTTGNTFFSGATINTPLYITTGGIEIDNSTFSEITEIEKTGTSIHVSAGGNTFNSNTVLRNSSTGGTISMGGTNPDIFNADLFLINSGFNSGIAFSNNSIGNNIAGNFVVENSAAGNTMCDIYIARFTADLNVDGNITITNSGDHVRTYLANSGSMTVGGNVTINNSGDTSSVTLSSSSSSTFDITGNLLISHPPVGGASHTTYIGSNGDITIGGDVNIDNSASGVAGWSIIYLSRQATSSTIIGGNTTVSNSSTAFVKRVYLGGYGDVTFNGTLDITNNSVGGNGNIYCNEASSSSNMYNDNIFVSSNNTSGAIYFGRGGGVGTLAATKTISIPGVDVTNFNGGQLYFRNFTQLGSTPQTLTLGPNSSYIYNYDSRWEGNVDFRAPRHITRGTTYDGTSYLEKNGSGNDASVGGNTFNGDAIIQNIGTGYFRPANTVPNDFNANATYVKTNTGLMYPSYDCINTYAGNITVDATTTVTFGVGANGRVLFDGTSAQSVNTVGATPTPAFRDIQTNNPNDNITLNTPVTVITELDLDNGHIISNSSNLLIMNDNSTVSSAGEAAFVSGPMRKIGNDAFEFPVGKNDTAYAPISISAPSGTGHHFTAEYFQKDPNIDSYSTSLHDISLVHISQCEYWNLDRTNGSSNVNVTLSWDDRSCGINQISELSVARWDGAKWADHSNGGTTGNTTNGTIITAAPVTSFSPFTLASTTTNNSLPVSLVEFDAMLNNNQVNLKWTTISELNNDFFTLQKSIDGKKWDDFHIEDGAGNSNSIINYTAVDYEQYNNVSYYRLKQTDFYGKSKYSQIVTVNNLNGNFTSTYPNPVKDILTIHNSDNTSNFKIYNANGQMVYYGNNTRINTSEWSSGFYQLIVYNSIGDVIDKLKIVK